MFDTKILFGQRLTLKQICEAFSIKMVERVNKPVAEVYYKVLKTTEVPLSSIFPYLDSSMIITILGNGKINYCISETLEKYNKKFAEINIPYSQNYIKESEEEVREIEAEIGEIESYLKEIETEMKESTGKILKFLIELLVIKNMILKSQNDRLLETNKTFKIIKDKFDDGNKKRSDLLSVLENELRKHLVAIQDKIKLLENNPKEYNSLILSCLMESPSFYIKTYPFFSSTLYRKTIHGTDKNGVCYLFVGLVTDKANITFNFNDFKHSRSDKTLGFGPLTDVVLDVFQNVEFNEYINSKEISYIRTYVNSRDEGTLYPVYTEPTEAIKEKRRHDFTFDRKRKFVDFLDCYGLRDTDNNLFIIKDDVIEFSFPDKIIC